MPYTDNYNCACWQSHQVPLWVETQQNMYFQLKYIPVYFLFKYIFPEGFKAEFFPLKYNPTTSECRFIPLKLIYIIWSN